MFVLSRQYGGLTASDIRLNRRHLVALMAELRPHMIPLTDAFDLPDQLVNSTLGAWDGDVYRRSVADGYCCGSVAECTAGQWQRCTAGQWQRCTAGQVSFRWDSVVTSVQVSGRLYRRSEADVYGRWFQEIEWLFAYEMNE